MNEDVARSQTQNLNILGAELLSTPRQVKAEIPISAKAEKTVLEGRRAVESILEGKDKRLLAVVGPCSIHDTDQALEYAGRLKALADELSEELCVVMRVYFEKPRTTVGWKGLINDPDLNDTFNINKGLRTARKLLLDLNELGLPAGTEALDPMVPQYIADLITWSAIGARTAESQTHREMASGLSMPVGFKNGTDGNVMLAVNAIESAMRAHHFVGITQDGRVARFATAGNKHGHVVLRGGAQGPNYSEEDVRQVESLLKKHGLNTGLVVDCSHGNSNKDHRNQPKVLEEIVRQAASGLEAVVGFMVESHLEEGNQSYPPKAGGLKRGVSITDKCVGWTTTESMLRGAAEKLRSR